MQLQNQITVCYFGTYRLQYSRNLIMMKGLIKNNVNVIECHVSLWTGIEDRVNTVKSGWLNPKFWKRVFVAYYYLFKKFKKLPPYDVLIVGYPGQFDVYFAKLLTLFKKKPIVWDVFMSIYLISKERDLHKKNPFSVKLIQAVENLALRLPDKLIIDTQQYANWFNKTYKVPIDRFCLVPTGADDDVFYLDQEMDYQYSGKLDILYYGTFIPNHGVPYIIEAARLLKYDPSIKFLFIGTGPELDRCLKLVDGYNLENVQFISWMGQEELKKFILEADIVLGAFGKTPQSLMTIQNKIYESMAMGKLVITGDSEAVKSVFQNYEDLIFCSRDEPNELSNIILDIKNNPGLINKIMFKSKLLFNESFTIERNGQKFLKCLRTLY